jgi:hypothetical protein
MPVAFVDKQGRLQRHDDDDDNSEILPSQPSDTDVPIPRSPAQFKRETADLLGFKPPSSNVTLRARKSKSHRAVLAGNLGDG